MVVELFPPLCICPRPLERVRDRVQIRGEGGVEGGGGGATGGGGWAGAGVGWGQGTPQRLRHLLPRPQGLHRKKEREKGKRKKKERKKEKKKFDGVVLRNKRQ